MNEKTNNEDTLDVVSEYKENLITKTAVWLTLILVYFSILSIIMSVAWDKAADTRVVYYLILSTLGTFIYLKTEGMLRAWLDYFEQNTTSGPHARFSNPGDNVRASSRG